MKRSQLGAGCPDPPTPPTEPTRRVFMYPVEYRAYGPDGINVVYERENCGVNAGQWVKRYLTTDYQGSVLQAHDASGNHEQHYELFGAEKGQVARRTGWLDREIDWETSPLSDLYRTVDLVNRKYDPQRATFLTSDPLWMMSADASSYHYGYHDPMNMIDPWGLDPLDNPLVPRKKNSDKPPVNVGPIGESGYGQNGMFDIPGSGFGGGGGGGSGGGGWIHNSLIGVLNPPTSDLPSSSTTGTGKSETAVESKFDKRHNTPVEFEGNAYNSYSRGTNLPPAGSSIDRESQYIAGHPRFGMGPPFHPGLYWSIIPTLVNRTNHTIWFKPEKDLTFNGQKYYGNRAYELPPGKSTQVPIDGIKINRYDTYVYKVPDVITTTIVESDDSVQPVVAGLPVLGNLAYAILHKRSLIGFVNHSFFGTGQWDSLFEAGK